MTTSSARKHTEAGPATDQPPVPSPRSPSSDTDFVVPDLYGAGATHLACSRPGPHHLDERDRRDRSVAIRSQDLFLTTSAAEGSSNILEGAARKPVGVARWLR